MDLHLLFHDRCFDGLACASLFTAFYRSTIDPRSEVTYVGLSHGPDGGLSEDSLGPSENVVVDFAYLPTSRLTWWFDHHRTAFQAPGAEAHFRADSSGQKFFDATAPSCTGFMARILESKFGFDPSPHLDLIRWAEVIDSASFASARDAVELASPALELMLWIERSQHFEDREAVIRALATDGLEAARALPAVSEALPALLEAHRIEADLIAAHCHREGAVVFCDLSEHLLDSVNKFVPYDLHPEASYAVIFSRTREAAKVSVGYNAWHDPKARRHDLSELCRKEGGGGHPYVGAIARRIAEFDTLHAIARRLVQDLNT